MMYNTNYLYNSYNNHTVRNLEEFLRASAGITPGLVIDQTCYAESEFCP